MSRKQVAGIAAVFVLGLALGWVVKGKPAERKASGGGGSVPLESLAPGTELVIAHTRLDGTHEGAKVKVVHVVGIDRGGILGRRDARGAMKRLRGTDAGADECRAGLHVSEGHGTSSAG